MWWEFPSGCSEVEYCLRDHQSSRKTACIIKTVGWTKLVQMHMCRCRRKESVNIQVNQCRGRDWNQDVTETSTKPTGWPNAASGSGSWRRSQERWLICSGWEPLILSLVTHLSCKALSLTVVDAVLLSVVFPWCTLIVLDVVYYQICEWWLSLTIRSWLI